MMTDEDILKDLAERVEKLRISKQMKESEIEEAAGISRKTLYNFKQGTTAFSLKNFIRLLRAIDEVDRLQLLFSEKELYNPLGYSEKELPKRVRNKGSRKNGFQWGDEK